MGRAVPLSRLQFQHAHCLQAILPEPILLKASVLFYSHALCVRSDENSRIACTEKQRGAKKSDILNALQDIRGAMIASETTHK